MNADGTNLSMVRGDSETFSVIVSGYDLVDGDIIEFTMRKNVNSPVLIHKTITSFTNNTATFVLSSSDTSSLSFGIYKYDIQLTTTLGEYHTIVPYSSFVIEKEVTYNE